MTAIYHITSLENLTGIIADGGLQAINSLARPHTSAAYTHIQERRAAKQVPVTPFGVLHDFVPFYFCPRSPMLYAIHNPRADQMKFTGGQKQMLHLVSSAETIAQHRIAFAFTDRHAVLGYAEFSHDLMDLTGLAWPYINANIWTNTQQYPDRRERKQAEFLVHRFVPWSLITEIGVINQTMLEAVQSVLDAIPLPHPIVKVRREWYY